MGLMYSRRFDRLFSEADATGQFATRPEVARAIIDWADADDQLFSPEGSAGAEDYRYDARADRYRAHDNTYDSIEEVKMVRGVSDGFMEAFAPHLTVYAVRPELQGQPGRDQQQERRRLHAAADGHHPGGSPARSDEARPPIRASSTTAGSTRSPASPAIARRRPASTASHTITSLMKNPQTAVLPGRPALQDLPVACRPITISDAELAKVAKVASPRVYRIVAHRRARAGEEEDHGHHRHQAPSSPTR